MLSYAFHTLHNTGFDNVASESFDNIHDLFSVILSRGVGAQVKRGLNRDYIRKEEHFAGLRGQIKVTESIKHQTLSQGKLVCAYDDFSPDFLYNRILKSVMLLLLRHGDVKTDNKKALHKVLLYFSEVTEITPMEIRWDSQKFHRNNSSYRMLMGICRLVVKGLLLTTEKGTYKLATWLQDEEMHRLYEKFVLAYYMIHHPGLSPKAAFINWDINDGKKSAYLPIMKSDISMYNGEKILIIDTKYYNQTMQINPLYDSRKYISSNLYQIYTYVKNADKGATGNVAGVLLYAKTSEAITPDDDMIIGGNRISLKTLDLNCDWNIITDQLESLCELLDGTIIANS